MTLECLRLVLGHEKMQLEVHSKYRRSKVFIKFMKFHAIVFCDDAELMQHNSDTLFLDPLQWIKIQYNSTTVFNNLPLIMLQAVVSTFHTVTIFPHNNPIFSLHACSLCQFKNSFKLSITRHLYIGNPSFTYGIVLLKYMVPKYYRSPSPMSLLKISRLPVCQGI